MDFLPYRFLDCRQGKTLKLVAADILLPQRYSTHSWRHLCIGCHHSQHWRHCPAQRCRCYTQVSALLTHKVDAVMGYLNNEAVQFRQANFAIRTFPASAAQPLISDGLAVPPSLISEHPGEVKALVTATLRGVQYTITHPQDAYTICKKYVTTLNDPSQTAAQYAVLQATIALFQPPAGVKMGYTNPADWQSMYTFLQSIGQLSGPVNVSQAYSDAYLP